MNSILRASALAKGVSYNDSTPSLTYTYNRLGNQATVADTTGTRTLNYNLAGTLEMQSEDLPSFFGSRRITWPRATTGVIGRPTGLQLGTSGSPTNDQSVTWGYDTYGRFNSFAGGGTTLAYTYTTNSNLLASVADSTSGWTQTRTYLSNRDLLDIIETKISTTSKAKFDYAHDNLGRRTSVNKTGDLYSRYGNGTQGLDTTWGYDDRSQVTSEQTKLGGSSTVLTGRDDAYAWDTMGNRSGTAGTTHHGSTAAYTSKALNQYTQRTVPGVFDVAGAAGSGTTVTVNSSSTGVTRHGEYFFKGQSMSNGSGAVFSTLAVSDGTTTTNIGAFLAGTPEAFTYDDDGNLLSDGRWDYVYDAENRLVSMQTHTALSPTPLANADARRVEFKNDYLGRRVQKTVRDGWNGSSFATVVSDEKFVYDGWNAIAKLNAASSNALIASYYWGLDWSGTLQGAGGVGGLALTVEGGNTYLPVYDGNGNVMGMIKASSGSIEAAYEYDAFGNTLRESGTYAASNSFRFSTKYTDIETGLVYYGLRYYSPSLGRFLNRDPIGEKGGNNLYVFCGNNAIARWDYMGLDPTYDAGWLPTMVVTPTSSSISGSSGGFGGFGGNVGFSSSSGAGFDVQSSGAGESRPLDDRQPHWVGNTYYVPDPNHPFGYVAAPTIDNVRYVGPLVSDTPTAQRDPIPPPAGLTPSEIMSAVAQGLQTGGLDVANAFRSVAESLGAMAGQISVDPTGALQEMHDTITTNLANGAMLIGDMSWRDVGRDIVTTADLYVNDHDFRQGITNTLATAGVGVALGGAGSFRGSPKNTFPANPDELMPNIPRTPKGHIEIDPRTRIRIEQHPLEPGETYSPRHHGQHYHVETRADPTKSWNNKNNVTKLLPPGYTPGSGTGFLPGEVIPLDP